MEKTCFHLIAAKSQAMNSDMFKHIFLKYVMHSLNINSILNVTVFWSTSIPSVLFLLHRFQWMFVIQIIQQKGLDQLHCIFKRLYTMKRKVMNIYFYYILRHSSTMELHTSNFPKLVNTADVIYSSQWLANPWGLFFICCSSGGHNGNQIHTRPLSQSA